MDFYCYTSQETLERLSRHCPRAISTYIVCLNHQDEDGELYLPKLDINEKLSCSYTKFKNDLKSLARENVLAWREVDKGVRISVANPVE